MENESDWSPGAVLTYTGGLRRHRRRARGGRPLPGRPGRRRARARRLRAGPPPRPRRRASTSAIAGLVAAGAVAIYPAFIYDAGRLMSEPFAELFLCGFVLAYLWASDPGRSPWAYAAPGVLLGLTAMFRPEYLPFSILFALLAGCWGWRRNRSLAAGPAVLPAVRPARRLRRHRPPLDDPQRRRARPLRPDLHGRRQGPLHRHLPPRRRRPLRHQARALLRVEPRLRPHPGRGQPAADAADPERGRRRAARARPRRGARGDREGEPRRPGHRAARRPRRDDEPQGRAHVAVGLRARHGRRLAGGDPRRAVPRRARRARAPGAPAPPRGARDRAARPRHHGDRRGAPGLHPPQPDPDADRHRLAGMAVSWLVAALSSGRSWSPAPPSSPRSSPPS